MSRIENITLVDGASTPVSHIFTPITPMNGSLPASWRNHSAGSTRMVDKDLTLSIATTSQRDKVKGKLVVPFLMDEKQGCCSPDGSLRREGLFTIEVLIPRDASDQYRKDLYSFLKSFVTSTAFTDAVTKNEVIF